MLFIKLFRFKTLALLAFILLVNLTGSLLAESDSTDKVESQTTSKRPPPPRRIPPNKVKPGGGLDSSYQSCNNANESLTALVPVENPVLTTEAYPSFLFYIPDDAKVISHGEFSVFTANDKERIYQTAVNFEQTPGIVKITLPPSTQNALETEQMYHWYFKVYCNDVNTQKVLDVDGWVQRVPLTVDVESKVANSSPDIWYDAIAIEAENLIANPQDARVRDRWLKLMQHIDREHLADIVPIKTINKNLD